MREIEEYQAALKPFIETWKSLEVRVLADLKNSVLLSMVACLTPNEPRPVEPTDNIQDIAFLRGSIPAAEVEHILGRWESGLISLGPYSLNTQDFRGVRFEGLGRRALDDFTLGWPELSQYAHFLLQFSGSKGLNAMVEPRDTWAIARVMGFSGFDELAMDRLRFQVGSQYSTRIEILAPVLVAIDADADVNKIRFNIRLHERFSVEHFVLTYRVEDNRAERLSSGELPVSSFKKQAFVGESSLLAGTLPLPPGSARAELLLRYDLYRSGSEPIAVARFQIPQAQGAINPRLATVQSLISNTRNWVHGTVKPEDVLRQWLGLSSPRPNSQEFERGIHCLLFLAGCSFLPIGEAEGVDIAVVGAESERIAALLSCTTSSSLGGKISDLQLQINRLADRLPDFSVYGAIFAPVEYRDLTVRTLEESEEANIKLVLLPEIKELHEMTTGFEWSLAHNRLIQIVRTPSSPSPLSRRWHS